MTTQGSDGNYLEQSISGSEANTEVEEIEYRGGGRVPGMSEEWERRPLCQEQVSRVAGNETRKKMGSQILQSPWPF